MNNFQGDAISLVFQLDTDSSGWFNVVMIRSEIEKLSAEAKAERDASIAKAEAKYQDALAHVKWFLDRLEKSTPRESVINDKHNGAVNGKSSLVAAVKESVFKLGEFTTSSVIEWLDKNHPEVKAPDRRTPVSVSLGRLKRLGIIEDLGKAGVGRLRKYRVVKEN